MSRLSPSLSEFNHTRDCSRTVFDLPEITYTHLHPLTLDLPVNCTQIVFHTISEKSLNPPLLFCTRSSKQIFAFVAFATSKGISVTMAPTVIADPDGDIVLLLDPEERDGPGSPSYNRHILCSSKHLTLASPIFKAMLKHTFSEGATLMTIGQVKIPLPEDDPTLMTSLVLLIHNRHNHPDIRPPRDLSLLNRAAILVDKYQIHEAVSYFTAAWARCYLDHNAIRFHPFREFPLLFCVAWVFELEAPFKEITRFIQYNCVGSIKDLMEIGDEDLPIPAGVIGTYTYTRVELLLPNVPLIQISQKCSKQHD